MEIKPLANGTVVRLYERLREQDEPITHGIIVNCTNFGKWLSPELYEYEYLVDTNDGNLIAWHHAADIVVATDEEAMLWKLSN